MSTAPASHESVMTPDETLFMLRRLAVQGIAAVDLPHANLKRLRLVGWIAEPDEHHQIGGGRRMMEAFQVLAGLNVKNTNTAFNAALNAPVNLPDKPKSDGLKN